MIDAYLGLGSNQNAERNMASGIAELKQAFGGARLSPLYRSPAVGFSGEDFLNAAACIRTDLSVGELKAWLTDLEDRHGRDRSQPKFSDRSLDIDILLHGDQAGNIDGLELPRDEILKYAHVLNPLAAIAPDFKHPVTGKTFADHWTEFKGDRSLKPVEV
ncbi:MAG: 2-amino-4-hydroxy-6-hydroxymethyldihydropteridine diphosphokinase [Wenzhouxiangella sp.]|nr:2-amino-4-hydroxy-6-hydroxymethyldihydropteridine diphosphokinase [Wenzhouxiangella sp.]